MNQTTLLSQGEKPSLIVSARPSPSLLHFWERSVKKIWEMQGQSCLDHRLERKNKKNKRANTIEDFNKALLTVEAPVCSQRCTTQQTVAYYPSARPSSMEPDWAEAGSHTITTTQTEANSWFSETDKNRQKLWSHPIAKKKGRQQQAQ